jgi:glycosyltransferase involved in cell wall biosynthesis
MTKVANAEEMVNAAVGESGIEGDSRQGSFATATAPSPEKQAAPGVIHFQRKPFSNQYSIECLFASLRDAMRELGQDATPLIAPHQSKGIWRRIANVVWAARNRGDVNHITGDVHYLALSLPRKRTILTIHDCHSLERLTGWKRRLLRLFWYDLPIRRAAIVTVISQETKRQLLRHVPADERNIEVVPNAVAPIFRPSPRPFRHDCPQILQIGTKPNKNLPRLIQALDGVRCHLKIIGPLNASHREQLDRSRISYDVQTQLDQEAMFRAYCECDLVSFVSTYEGFGMPIIEAQWVERPVLTSNCSSMPEVAGLGACFVDPFDVDSIRRGIDRISCDSAYREKLIEHGRVNRQGFALAEVARRYLQLYQRLSRAAKSDSSAVGT